MASLKLVWFLCGFLISLVNLSSVLSLECNFRLCSGSECSFNEPEQCTSGSIEQCRTVTYDDNRFPEGSIVFAGCSHHCDEDSYCRGLALVNPGSVSNCALKCCNTDLCNAPDNDKESSPVSMLDKKKLPKKMKEIKKMLEKLEKSRKN